MSSKKIDYYNGQNIAQRVTDKAFEHLYGPAHAAVTAEAQHVYELFFKHLGLHDLQIKRMLDCQVLEMRKYCDVKFKDGDKEHYFTLGVRGYEPAAPESWVCPTLQVPPELEPDLLKVYTKFKQVEDAKTAFYNRVHQDITGRSIPSVIKKWPEIKGFIEDVYGEQMGNDLVVPFSDLIKKYMSPLMALPAPEAA